MLNRDHAVRDQEALVHELQKVLLNALYLVNQLLVEIPAEPAARVRGKGVSRTPRPCEGEPVEAEVAPDVTSACSIGQLENMEGPIGNSSPRDLP
jgi:hypothetical protein